MSFRFLSHSPIYTASPAVRLWRNARWVPPDQSASAYGRRTRTLAPDFRAPKRLWWRMDHAVRPHGHIFHEKICPMKRASLFRAIQAFPAASSLAAPVQATMMTRSESADEAVNDDGKYRDISDRGLDHEGRLKLSRFQTSGKFLPAIAWNCVRVAGRESQDRSHDMRFPGFAVNSVIPFQARRTGYRVSREADSATHYGSYPHSIAEARTCRCLLRLSPPRTRTF